MMPAKSTDIHLRASTDGTKEHEKGAKDRSQVPGSMDGGTIGQIREYGRRGTF